MVATIPIGLFLDRIQPKYAILISGLLYLFGLFFLVQDKMEIFNFICFNILNSLSFAFYGASSNKQLKQICSRENVDFNVSYSKKMSFRKIGNLASGLVATAMLSFLTFDNIIYIQFILSLLFVGASLGLSNIEFIKNKKIFNFENLPFKEIFDIVVNLFPFFFIVDLFLIFIIEKITNNSALFTFLVTIANLCVIVAVNKASYFHNFFPKKTIYSILITLSPLVAYLISENPYIAIIFVPISIFSRGVSIFKMGDMLRKINSNQMATCEAIVNTLNTLSLGIASILFANYFVPHQEQSIFYLKIFLLLFVISYSFKRFSRFLTKRSA